MKQFLKLFVLFTIMSIILIVSTSQKAKTTNTTQPSMNDSTAVISIVDANDFIKLLGNVPHDQYLTIDARQAIREFVNWKLALLNKKSLTDTTKKK